MNAHIFRYFHCTVHTQIIVEVQRDLSKRHQHHGDGSFIHFLFNLSAVGNGTHRDVLQPDAGEIQLLNLNGAEEFCIMKFSLCLIILDGI